MAGCSLGPRNGPLLGQVLVCDDGWARVHESRLEPARLPLADFDPEVRGIFAQPCRLAARVGDRTRHHVPDFLLVMRSGTVRV